MPKAKSYKISVGDKNEPLKSYVKYLELNIEKHLSYQKEVKAFLRQMARGNKAAGIIKQNFPWQVRITSMLGLQLSSYFIDQKVEWMAISIEHLLISAMKSCYKEKKHNWSTDLKIENLVLAAGCDFFHVKHIVYFDEIAILL